MKVRNSLKSLKGRHRDNRVAKRKGRMYIINKTNPRFKASKVSSLVSPYIKGYANSIFFRLKGHSFMKK